MYLDRPLARIYANDIELYHVFTSIVSSKPPVSIGIALPLCCLPPMGVTVLTLTGLDLTQVRKLGRKFGKL